MKIVVFDDDPTGSQTVYGCPLLLNWGIETLRRAIRHPSPLLFILSNTRSLTEDLAILRIREICRMFTKARKLEGLTKDQIIFISRGDSTLRGHGYIEPFIINEEIGPFDATFHVPAFLEGRRTTVNGVHFLDGMPVHKTIFGRDNIFGYSTSDLPLWLQEKSNGVISAKNVDLLNIDILDFALESKEGMNHLLEWLFKLSGNRSVVVDAENSFHLEIFAKAIQTVRPQKRFLFRSAASLVNRLANLPTSKKVAKDFSALRLLDERKVSKPGLILVGSHVLLADQQLTVLLEEKDCIGLELPVRKIARVLEGAIPDLLLEDLEEEWLVKIQTVLSLGKTPVVYTSRGELSFSSSSARFVFGLQLANLMASLTKKVISKIGYIVSKGGITTHVLLSKGLALEEVELVGQILPGLSVIEAQVSLDKKTLPVLTFPGNLGDKNTLLEAWKLMEEREK